MYVEYIIVIFTFYNFVVSCNITMLYPKKRKE